MKLCPRCLRDLHPDQFYPDRSKKSGLGTYCRVSEVEALIDSYLGLCAYCARPWEHLDHVEPLSLGGAHVLANLVPACAGCNLSKSGKPLLVWLATRDAPITEKVGAI